MDDSLAAGADGARKPVEGFPVSHPLLTVKDAARRAGVSPALVRTWVRDRALPHLRVGAKGRRGKILIDPPDLDALLASFKVGAKAALPPPPAAVPAPPASAFTHLRLA